MAKKTAPVEPDADEMGGMPAFMMKGKMSAKKPSKKVKAAPKKKKY